ncbi:MAG: EscU/YscU/HrcU family type III secretion system export apparatus switch protein, partial [Francisellaceae bacterium]
MAEKEENRNEKATDYKLKKAKEKGQVAKSLELPHTTLLAAMTLLFLMLFQSSLIAFLQLCRRLFVLSTDFSTTQDNIITLMHFLINDLIGLVAPLMAAIVLTVVFSHIVQSGLVWSTHPLKPDFTRINPAMGFKKIINTKLIFELIKTLLKFLIFALVIYIACHHETERLMSLMMTTPQHYPVFLTDDVLRVTIALLIGMVIIAAIDLLYSRWYFSRDMRMSRRELKEEMKSKDGDPLIKQKRRQNLKALLAKSASVNAVKTADVLIVNPTHIAVSLKYDRTKMIAPQITAQGAGFIAKTMKKLAQKHQVMIEENKPLARKLYPQVGKLLIKCSSKYSFFT